MDIAVNTTDSGIKIVVTTVEYKVTATRDRQVVDPKVVQSTNLKLAGVAAHIMAFTAFAEAESVD